MKHSILRLRDGETVATIQRTLDGEQWRAQVTREGLPNEYRYFPITENGTDDGLLRVARGLRREFGITGTYRPVR